VLAELEQDLVAVLQQGADQRPAVWEVPVERSDGDLRPPVDDAGVSQVVKISVWGAREGGRLGLGAHWQIEQYLKASGLSWSILQPGGFMQNFLTGAGSVTSDGSLIDGYGGAAVSYVDCHDIAACAAALLTASGRGGESLVLTGPEALTHAAIAESSPPRWAVPWSLPPCRRSGWLPC
jgi:NAD(P)H dehydrogenase (quinone)